MTAPTAGTLILIVDDQDMVLYQKARLFRREGYEVLEAATGQAALDLVRLRRPRLVLLDINLPDIDGWEVCRRIKADPETSSVLVLHTSATYVGEDYHVRSLEGGADACLSEPTNPSVLRATVRALLRAREAEDALREALGREQAARASADESRRAAEAANRAKDEFLATLSHELRSPLGTILTWSTLLRTGELDETRTARGLEAIERNARLQAQLMEDLLDVSRIISGQLRLDFGAVRLERLAEATLESTRQLAGPKNLRLEARIQEDMTPILGDATRLQQVLWNLLTNAVKFTPSGGTVTLLVSQQGEDVVIEVADTGAGIDAQFLPHIFERFRQADSSSTRAQGGLGLGLAIVRHIIEGHGGTIVALSEGRGHGARFVARFPRRTPGNIDGLESSGEMRAVAALTSPRLEGIRVLVVDDELDALEGTVAMLEAAGAVVRSAGSPSLAVAEWRAFAPQVLVSDIAMPGEDGITLLRNLRQIFGDEAAVPAVAVTAYARVDDEERMLAAGYQAYVSKPIEARRLIDAVAETARALTRE